jgi:drug/metabolite transporter (DMT)-like permease
MKGKFISWAIFVVLCLIWGSSFKLMRDSSAAISAPQIAAIRIFSAGLVFLPFAFFHFSKIPRAKTGFVILSAVFGNLLPAFLFAIALTKIDASLGGILNSLTPICVVVVSILFFKSKIGSLEDHWRIDRFPGIGFTDDLPGFTGRKNDQL